MKTNTLKIMTGIAAFAAFGLFAALPASAEDIDWDSVQGKDITLLYPGQASWEWVLTKSDHTGASKIREGKTCADCHEGEEASMGNLIVSGQKVEPNPIPGKRGAIPVNVKVAHDADNFYIRLEWTQQPNQNFPNMDPKYDTKVTVMFDDGSVPEAKAAGCWGTCHDDATGMASSNGQELHKYLSKSRSKLTRQGGGRNYVGDADLAALEAKGYFMEYWQAALNEGQPATVIDGHILKAREADATSDVKATASFSNGAWVVVFSRPLNPEGDYRKALVPGTTYTFGVAIHEDHSAGRFHHVSVNHTFVLDSGDAELVAAGQ